MLLIKSENCFVFVHQTENNKQAGQSTMEQRDINAAF
jgi:hypothetical protein